jgi:hypothetical protein
MLPSLYYWEEPTKDAKSDSGSGTDKPNSKGNKTD